MRVLSGLSWRLATTCCDSLGYNSACMWCWSVSFFRNYVIMKDRLGECWLAESPGFNSGIFCMELALLAFLVPGVSLDRCPCLLTAGIDRLGKEWVIETSKKEKSSTSINLRPQTTVLMEPAFTEESSLTSLSDDSITKAELNCKWK